MRIIQAMACTAAWALLAVRAVAAPAATSAASMDNLPGTGMVEPAGTNHAKIPVVFFENASQTSKSDAFHVELGTRILHVSLLAATKGSPYHNSFIGSIYKLDAYQNYLPLRPYAQITKRVGVIKLGLGVSYDHLKVATLDDSGGDGDIQMENVLFYLMAAYPNETRFTPFGEFGLSAYWNSFDPEPTWSQNGLREFDLENSYPFYLAAGCDIDIAANFSANFYVRYVNVDVDGTFIFRGDSSPPEPFVFTVENIAYGIGVKYVF